MTETIKTVAVQHPNMSHALILDGAPHTERGYKAWAALYVAKYFDEVLPVDEFVVLEVPSETGVEFSIFDAPTGPR